MRRIRTLQHAKSLAADDIHRTSTIQYSTLNAQLYTTRGEVRGATGTLLQF